MAEQPTIRVVEYTMPIVTTEFMRVLNDMTRGSLERAQAYFDRQYAANPTPWTMPFGGGQDEVEKHLDRLAERGLPYPPLIKVHLSDAQRHFGLGQGMNPLTYVPPKVGLGYTVMGIPAEIIPDPVTEDQRRMILMSDHMYGGQNDEGEWCHCGHVGLHMLHLYDVIVKDAYDGFDGYDD